MDDWDNAYLMPDEPEDTSQNDSSAEIDGMELSSVEDAGTGEVILPGDQVISGEVIPVAGYVPLMGHPLMDPPAVGQPESGGVGPIDRENGAAVEDSRPWGFWATLGLSLVVGMTFILLQAWVIMVFVFIKFAGGMNFDMEEFILRIAFDGFVISLATILTGVACTLMVILFAAARRNLPWREYLGMKYPSLKQWVFWLPFYLSFVFIMDMSSLQDGQMAIPEFMVKIYESARFLPLLVIALVVAAPIFEEMFFRGFMLIGFRRSWMGAVFSVIVTSALWAAIHLQYDFWTIVMIFFMGLFLGAARLKTGSIYLPIVMHAISNLIATIQVALHVSGKI